MNLRTYQRKWRIDAPLVTRYIRKVWKTLQRTPDVNIPEDTELSLVFLNNRRMQWYNAQYRKKDYPTDVLSFPVNEITVEHNHYLGDILVSVEKAAAQAREKGHNLNRELEILLLHGVLHLLGYDHEVDAGEMDHLEARLRRKLLDGARLAVAQ